MENNCKSCGTPLEEGARFCPNCGVSTVEVPVPAAPAAKDFGKTLSQFMKYILIALAVISLTLAIFDLGGFFDVTMTASLGELKHSESGKVSELYKQPQFVVVAVGNIACGIFMVMTGAIATLGTLKEFKVSAISEKIFGKGGKLHKEFGLVGLWGTIATAFQILCYLLVSANDMGIEYKLSLAAPWFAWVALVLFVAVLVLDKVVLNKKKSV